MSFTIRPLLVAEGSQACLTLCGLTPGRDYRVTIVPTRLHGAYREAEVRSDSSGCASWTQEIDWRGVALCDVFAPAGERALATLRIYAAAPDVMRRRPMRCDLHLHTTYSDGTASPAEMVLRGRELGLDALAISDHNEYQGSLDSIEAARDLGLGIVCFPAEEVSAPDWHLLALGTSARVGRPEAGYSGMRRALDTIHGLGGRAYLAHPFWTHDRRHHLPPQDFDRLLAEGGFDGIELIGDVEWEDNLRSLARYGDARAAGQSWPILGNSDSHRANHTYGGIWTLVLAEALTREAILQAIAEHYSLACTLTPLAPPGQRVEPHFQAFGPFDLVDLAIFLHREYYPQHDLLCRQEAALARRAATGDVLPEGLMESAEDELEVLYRESWGLQKETSEACEAPEV